MKEPVHTAFDILTAGGIRGFQRMVLDYYRRCGRDLPWRFTTDPYQILVSEFMLQQTQVDRVLPKYKEFILRFPDAAALARAPLHKVLAAWSGLGYNRRAQSLKMCAEVILTRYGGTVPNTQEALEQLPGIGPYTARAVCVFAYNQPRSVLETNIRAVYIYFFFAGQARVQDADLLPYIEKTLYRRNPRRWYNALMDYGVMLKKAFGNPSRTSTRHTRQSPFKGSNREIRGAIIKSLLMHQACTEAVLSKKTGFALDRVKPVLYQLLEEGLVRRQGSRIDLP
jgi:A/G-specific adenine glycosylase